MYDSVVLEKGEGWSQHSWAKRGLGMLIEAGRVGLWYEDPSTFALRYPDSM